jgi:magnesium-transporting ATPase (P-type)
VLREIARASLLCNDAELSPAAEAGAGRWQGDPTEGAMLVLAAKAGLDRDGRADSAASTSIPFESENRFMATLHAGRDGGRWIFVKGAPERVLEMCDRVRAGRRIGDARPQRLAGADRRRRGRGVPDARAWPAGSAADDQETLSVEDVASGLTLLGVVGMIDPPRPEAIEAVAKCQRAGIRVKMITGDHALTARSIGAQMGIGDGERAVTGQRGRGGRDAELVAAGARARRLRALQPGAQAAARSALQAQSEVAAMTGDGVNDAPR